MKTPRANDRGAQRLEKELALERAETRKADLRWAMASPRGRRLLFELLYSPTTGLGFDHAPLTSNGSLQYGEAAKRAVARLWVERLKAELPEAYLRMLEEQLTANDEAKHLREAEETPDEGEDGSP